MGGPSDRPRPASVAVVIPMYDEEAGAERCVREVCAELDRLGARARLIVVDDGSRDRTSEVLARAAAAQPRLQVVSHDVNRGYGSALRTGVVSALEGGFDYVLFMDSDLTNSPADIPRLLAEATAGVDVVKATRYRGGGGFRGVPVERIRWSRLGNAFARVMFRIGISDCTNGFRCVRASVLGRLRLREPRFAVILEELYCCLFVARSFAEVPVVLTGRGPEMRPTSFVYRPAALWSYLKYALRAGLRIPPGSRIRSHVEDTS